MLFLIFAFCTGFTFVQTDWSGDSSTPGPVASWQNNFLSLEDLSTEPGELYLLEETVSIRHQISPQSAAHICAAGGDISGGGFTDIASVNVDNSTLTWWHNTTGDGKAWTENQISDQVGGARFCRVTDLDSDSDQDIAVVTSFENQLIWFENADGVGGEWEEHLIHDQFDGARALWEGDFNADGSMDIAAVATGGNTVGVWINEDNGSQWQMIILSSTFAGAWSVHVADIDGDQDEDVIAAALMGGVMSWWENTDGLGTQWQEHAIDPVYPGARSIHAFDADNDGDYDVLGGSISEDVITLWENENSIGTSWVKHEIAEKYFAVKSVSSCDVNRDGYPDILGAAYLGEGISWFENPGALELPWNEHPVTPSLPAASFLTSCDVDSDGYLDALGVSYNYDGIAWWDFWGYGEGSLTSSILDSQEYPVWETVSWDADLPSGSSVQVQVRGSEDPDSMGDWSQFIVQPGSLIDILSPGSRFIQYRIALFSEDGNSSPEVHHIEFTSSSAGGIENSTEESPLTILSGNPSMGSLIFSYNSNTSSLLELVVADISGRMVQVLHDGNIPVGLYSFQTIPLPTGVYSVCAIYPEGTQTIRIVVFN